MKPILTISFLFVLASCGVDGALRQATLTGQCAAADVACSRRHPQAPLAVGARFYPDVAVDIAGNTTPALRLESAAPDIVAIEGGALVARRPGASAVLISTDDGSIVDFIHVWVAPATHMTLARRDGERLAGTLGLVVGEDLTIIPSLWNDSQRLSGSTDVTWTTNHEGPVAILQDGSGDRRRLRARAAGKATITAAVGDVTASLDVEVVP